VGAGVVGTAGLLRVNNKPTNKPTMTAITTRAKRATFHLLTVVSRENQR
jgi:hypothetical protein